MQSARFTRRSLIAVAPLTALVAQAAAQPSRGEPEAPMEQDPQPQGAPDGSRWDRVFSQPKPAYRTEANAFLAYALERMQREELLPGKQALDLAMGDGRNALLMAEKGLRVTGLDISKVALEKARAKAAEKKLELEALEQDLFTYDYGVEKWDLVTVVYFNPAVQIFEKLKAAVKPGGLIVVEGQGSEHTGEGPPPATRFRPNQLVRAFLDWRIQDYQDGRFECDWAPGPPTHVVRLMARKTAPAGK